MGNFFSKKNGFEKQLLDMETKILNLEDKLSNSRIFHQKVLHKIVLYSFAIEFLIVLFTYVKSRSLETISDKLFCCIYSILFPLFIFIITKIYGFLYKYLIKKNEIKLDNLKTGLQKKLDERKRETDYENTQKLLDRYEGIINNKKKKNPSSPTNKPISPNINNNGNNNGLRNRNNPVQLNQPFNIANQQHQRINNMQQQTQLQPQNQQQNQQIQQQQQLQQQQRNNSGNTSNIQQSYNKPPSPMHLSQQHSQPHPQQISQQHTQQSQSQPQQFNQNRNNIQHKPSSSSNNNKWWLDKLVDYLISDGPNHGSPLICSNCHSHNGYVPGDELSNIQFRCRICKTFNQKETTDSIPINNNNNNSNASATSSINSNGSNVSRSSNNENNNSPQLQPEPSIDEIDKNNIEDDKILEEDNNNNNTPTKSKKGKGKGKTTPIKKSNNGN